MTSKKYRCTIKVREMRAPANDLDVPFAMDLTEERWTEAPAAALRHTYEVARLVCSSDEGTEKMVEELTKQGYVFAGGDRRPPRGYFVFQASIADVAGFWFTTPLDNDLWEYLERVEGLEQEEQAGEFTDVEPVYETYEDACVAAWTHADELWLGAPPDLPAIPKYPQLPRGFHAYAERREIEDDEGEVILEWVWECVGPDGKRFGEFRDLFDGEGLHKAILGELRSRETVCE